MGFFDFLRRKKDGGANQAISNKTISGGIDFVVGQTLYTRNGDPVKLCEIEKYTIIIEYKQERYVRNKELLGKTLFTTNPANIITAEKPVIIDNKAQHDLPIRQVEKNELNTQIEFQKKTEEDRRLNRQQESDKKIIEEPVKEKTALQNREEEYRRQQEQQKIIEHRLMVRDETQKTKEEEQRKKEQARLNRISEIELTVGEFRCNETILYHEVYGDGIFIDFDSSHNYMHIKFADKLNPLRFTYPDSIGIFLFLKKTEKVLKRDEFLKSPQNRQEDLEEREYFSCLCKKSDASLKKAQEEENLLQYGYNDFSDSFDPEIFTKHKVAIREMQLWRSIRNDPYFARVDYDNDKKIYIGKNVVDGFVVDWRDKVCNLYYRYNIYIDNVQYNLSLVRDFEIVTGNYCGFTDKYSKKSEYSSDEESSKIIADEYLLNVINASRRDKKANDIIRTIQRNQYEIITHSETANMVILGCAGSGKTMIMLHRLSYIVFNNKEVDLNSIYIISPTKFLMMENDELSTSLNLAATNRMEARSFNIRILNEYYKRNKTYDHNHFGKTINNNMLQKPFIEHIYSQEFIKKFKEEIQSILFFESENRKNFIEQEETLLIDEFAAFCDEGVEIESIQDIPIKLEAINNYYEEVKIAVSKLPYVNARKKIESLKEQIANNNKNNTISRKKELLEHLVNFWQMQDKEQRKENGEISLKDTMFDSVYGYFDAFSDGFKANKQFLKQHPYLSDRFSDSFELIVQYKPLAERLDRFKRFVLKNDKDYHSELINRLIVDIKNQHHIDLDKVFEFEIFLHMVGCNVTFGCLHEEKVVVFVDEFQDYSSTELDSYAQTFPMAVFNFFGDLRQKVNEKGLSERDFDISSCSSWERFAINENYRNAHQITEFVNSTFDMSMLPIGIDGLVARHDINSRETEIEFSESDRVALIVKNLELYDNIKAKQYMNVFQHCNVIVDEECEIKRGQLNIIPINFVKGLEFEQVFVVPNQMTENEKYVAFTRALNKLYVLDLS